MTTCIGTKVVDAKPMTRIEYIDLRGWTLPDDENPDDEGYLVEYLDGIGKPNHPEYSGYISWSPKEVFEAAYRDANTGLSFGGALEALQLGFRVARRGWNGKGMWLSLTHGRLVNHNDFWSYNLGNHALRQPTGEAKVLPCINMKTATGEVLMGWLASQTDMLSHDWFIIPREGA